MKPILDKSSLVKITDSMVNAAKSGNGGWNRQQFAVLGISYPPTRGWKALLVGQRIELGEWQRFLDARTAETPRKKRRAEERAVAKTQRRTERRAKAEPPRIFKPANPVAGSDFLQTFEWKRLRMEALRKYGAVCQCCGASPKTGAVMNVDHIKPRKLFPELALSLSNLQVLCGECNHGKGNWDMTDWRTKEATNA